MVWIEELIAELDGEFANAQGSVKPWGGGADNSVRQANNQFLNLWHGLGGFVSGKWQTEISGISTVLSQVVAGVTQLAVIVANFYEENAADHVHIWNSIYASLVQFTNAAVASAALTTQTLVGGAVDLAEGLYNLEGAQLRATASTIVHYAQQLYNASIAHTDNAAGVLLHYAQQLYNASIAHTDNAAGVLLHYSQQLYNQAVAHVDQVVSAEANRATQAEGMVTHLAQQLYNLAISHADAVGATVLGLATAKATSLVAALQTQLAPQINKLQTEQDTCLAPLCDTVTPNAQSLGKLGNLLTGLEQDALLLILVALLAEAVADPQAAANDVASLATDAVSLGEGLAKLVAGILP